MESGLEDRNNLMAARMAIGWYRVSMESGLEDRNNPSVHWCGMRARGCLNGVRPRRPEQSVLADVIPLQDALSQWSPA